MVKKLFVLASITALTGLLATTVGAGCSSDPAPGETPDAATTPDATPTRDSGPDPDVEEPVATCPSTKAIAEADVAALFKWQPPTPTQSVCNQTNLDDLKALFTKGMGSAKFTDIKTTLGPTCGACAFTKTDAANWGVIVEDTNGFLRNETASCLAQLESAACGKAAFTFETCLKLACPAADCGDDAAVTACNTKAAKGACKDLNSAVTTSCPKLQADLDVCGGILDAIAISCGGGQDGGLDASAP